MHFTTSEWELDTFDIDRIDEVPLLFLTGYLTIKEAVTDEMPAVYLLDIPNNEVRMAFNLHVLGRDDTQLKQKNLPSASRRSK